MKSSALSLLGIAPLALAASFDLPLHRRSTSASSTSYEATRAAALRDVALKQSRYFPELASKNTKRSTGSVAMTDVDADTQYYAQISVGTPPQSLNVILDTGSADLVLATSPCTGCETGTTLYDSTTSSTSSTSETSFSITYGTGSASGTLVTDVVSFGGISIPNQTFAGCTDLDSLLTESYESGLLGLGWKGLANSEATPLVEEMYSSGLLDEPVFAMAYATFSDDTSAYSSQQKGGVLSLGGVNGALYTGNISYNDLVGSPAYWSIALEDVLVNGKSMGIAADSVIIDSGTTLISMPSSAVSTIYTAVGSYETDGDLVTYDSSANPTFALVFGGVAYEVGSFSYGEQSETTNYGIVYDASEGTSDSTYIIGDAFLKSVYSVFNFEQKAVGFATLVDSNDELEDGTEPTSVGSASAVVAATTTALAVTSTHTTSATASTASTSSSIVSPSAPSAGAQGPLDGFGGAFGQSQLSDLFGQPSTTALASFATNAAAATSSSGSSSTGGPISSGAGRLGASVGVASLAVVLIAIIA